ncbi:hypothetical protein GCM10007079_46260 [Nocardiopsis terrae]|uniref:Uncharacterized protein n=1 Tax=Nocardiopsis terrae TaxID=372655 RepID=A0ABR9HKQ2_9ACTN|nr:hypothetical protein [Nocardiopsis terrae]MBE1459566.1 hypothetical protein [Nocardiopsis terrae]GHC95046.1 hypothetical protein GCM10007079_46260 [Nocardiopsis terrae]
MSRLLSRNSTLVYPDYGMFQIFDCEDYDDTAPVPGRNDFSAGECSVYLRSLQTNVLVHLDLESWESEPAWNGEEWEGSHTAVIELATGVVGVNEITAGGQHDLLTLPAPGRYRVRAAHRNRRVVSKAYMALFDRFEDVHGPGFTAAARDLEGREQYLAQFWPEP